MLSEVFCPLFSMHILGSLLCGYWLWDLGWDAPPDETRRHLRFELYHLDLSHPRLDALTHLATASLFAPHDGGIYISPQKQYLFIGANSFLPSSIVKKITKIWSCTLNPKPPGQQPLDGHGEGCHETLL